MYNRLVYKYNSVIFIFEAICVIISIYTEQALQIYENNKNKTNNTKTVMDNLERVVSKLVTI